MNQVKKKHHTTPEMHLQHFVGDKPKGNLWVYDKTQPKPFSRPPNEIGHQRYFYAVRKPDGQIDNRLEDFLGKIESKAAPIYENLLLGNQPQSAQERHDFATFLSLMYFRTPTMRRIHAEMRAAAIQNSCYAHTVNNFDEMVNGTQEQTGKVFTEEQKKRLKQAVLDPKDYIVQVPAEATLDALSSADKLTPLFEKMHWVLLYPKHGFFITCDNPVYRAVDPKTIHPIMGDGGFYNKSLHITFPLSPKAALLMSWQRPPKREIEVERAQVELFNGARAYSAERFVYSHIQHKKLSNLVEQHKDSKIKFQAQGYGPKNYSEVKVKPPARAVKTE